MHINIHIHIGSSYMHNASQYSQLTQDSDIDFGVGGDSFYSNVVDVDVDVDVVSIDSPRVSNKDRNEDKNVSNKDMNNNYKDINNESYRNSSKYSDNNNSRKNNNNVNKLNPLSVKSGTLLTEDIKNNQEMNIKNNDDYKNNNYGNSTYKNSTYDNDIDSTYTSKSSADIKRDANLRYQHVYLYS
jgi:hypothetical protein